MYYSYPALCLTLKIYLIQSPASYGNATVAAGEGKYAPTFPVTGEMGQGRFSFTN